MKTETIKVRGMTCSSCEKILEGEISKIPGVNSVKAYAEKGELIVVMEDEVDEKDIYDAIKKEGYSTGEGKAFIAIALGALVVLVILYFMFGNSEGSFSPESDASFIALFLLGLLTGFHCVGMCGGFVMSYSLSGKNSVFHHASYGVSRLLSYTLIGAIFGLIGSAIAFTNEMRAAAAFFAGVFLILYGIGMLGIIPRLNRLKAGMPSFFGAIFSKAEGKSPVIMGLINGLMIACGPLQAMYIFAAGTGDAVAGALSLFAFGLGTIPAMFTLGALGSAIGAARLGKLVKYSGVMVIFLGIIMFSNGLALSGAFVFSNLNSAQNASVTTEVSEAGEQEYQEIRMDVTYRGYEPNSFVLKKGVPVRWIINGIQISGCNNEIILPAYDMEIEIRGGEQVIEFIPDETGTVGWSCWMGMIRGQFIVVDEGSPPQQIKNISSASIGEGTCGIGETCAGSCGSACGE